MADFGKKANKKKSEPEYKDFEEVKVCSASLAECLKASHKSSVVRSNLTYYCILSINYSRRLWFSDAEGKGDWGVREIRSLQRGACTVTW